MPVPQPPNRTDNIVAVLCLGLAVLFHAWGASAGWSNLNLPGCEFRQAQTAISTYFIQKEGDYSLAYPTPVLGKPWSIPMEFPLYQWTVARVAGESGWSLTEVGRGVSLVCFYLALPALYLLLRRLGFSGARSAVVLCFVLCCPLYIFYARSFLIETMAWMFGAWFLLGYVLGVERRSAGWLAVAALGGVGAGLVKVTTLMAYLFPAFTWTLFWFWQDWRSHPPEARGSILRSRIAWCAAAVVLPFLASWWWVRYSDHVKAESTAGSFLRSASMAGYNFGVGVRFDPAVWAQHWTVLFNELASIPVLVFTGVIALFFAQARWWLIGILVGYFFAVQLMFPILYAWHDYYYVATAMLLMAAIGIALCSLFDSRLPRGAAWIIVGGVLVAQGRGYYVRHYDEQKHFSTGGSELTVALRAVTDPDDVIVIAGEDWNSMIPYYAQRRALMIRRDLEYTWEVLDPAFAALKDESVTALVLTGDQRKNQALLNRVVNGFKLDPRIAFQWRDSDVYLAPGFRVLDLEGLAGIPAITLPGEAQESAKSRLGQEVETTGWLRRHQARLARITPLPWKYFTTFGLTPVNYDGHSFLWIHPVTRLWFRLPAGRHHLSAQVEFLPGAYDEKVIWQDRSDGVALVVSVQGTDGVEREVGRRLLDPRSNLTDRGHLTVDFDFSLEQAASVQFAVLPGPADSSARDWILLDELKLE